MEPVYMLENRYTYHVASWRPAAAAEFQVTTPETVFERQVQGLYIQGQVHLQHEEYLLAQNTFRELMALILRTANPQMPVDSGRLLNLEFPRDPSLLNVLAQKTGEILKNTPIAEYKFPISIVSGQSILPAAVTQQLKPAIESDLQLSSHHALVKDRLVTAFANVAVDDFEKAIQNYQAALDNTPAEDRILRASLLHDMAVLFEKANKKQDALTRGSQGLELFKAAGNAEAEVQALETVAGILQRAGNAEQAKARLNEANAIRSQINLNPILSTEVSVKVRPFATSLGMRSEIVSTGPVLQPIGAVGRAGTLMGAGATTSATAASAAGRVSTTEAPQLMALMFVQPSQVVKSLTVQGMTTALTIALDNNATANVTGFLQALQNTADLAIVTQFWATPTRFVAYLPHMYFFTIPMSIADCVAGLGNLTEAELQYRGVLEYPFINRRFEVLKLWSRLAEVYLGQGDAAYRSAKDNVAAFVTARRAYENVVLANRTLKADSPLYEDEKFATVKNRITAFLAAPDPVEVTENPVVMTPVLEALTKLQQIDAGLNFFGFGKDYVPPFSFEYLQNTARYFAQQASQIEHRYVQFKSTAENEELRREQIDQQAEVARQTVVLEQRGVAEAQAGINVAQANLNSAEVQRRNAIAARDDFNAVRWELLELAMLEAWGSATSVKTDDQIKFNIDWTYYQSSKKPRNQVLMDLAGQRTRISHNLEAAKLNRAIDAANAYKGVAQEQVAQAQARRAVAEQRVKIAQLQQRNADENREFLDMKEFSAGLWYDLANHARRLSHRYLDMATEVAFLMERAYNAETERGIIVIRYDYSRSTAANLMGADFLAQDIDYFTLDHVTNVRSRKALVKKVISVADRFPMAFHQLRTTGNCVFQTEMEEFDREHPGLYLCKIKNVELLFVGLTGSTTLAGSLRNIGISKFRREDGSIITRVYPADVMLLSQYSLRQDVLAFRVNPNDLRLFENNGIDTLWQLQVPRNANTFNYNELLDVQLVLYYDGFFSPTLETTVKAALPAGDTASRGFSMRMWYPDELFYLKNQGQAEVEFEPGMFPNNQTNLKRIDVKLKMSGAAETINGMTLRLKSQAHGSELVVASDANGEVNVSALLNENLIDTWNISITPADNAGLVMDGKLNLSGLQDVLAFFEYSFDYLN
jgi:hypothetical protein